MRDHKVRALHVACSFKKANHGVQAGEARAAHEQEVSALGAEIESLQKNEEMSSVLIRDMQKQVDEYAHNQTELEVLRSALFAFSACEYIHINTFCRKMCLQHGTVR